MDKAEVYHIDRSDDGETNSPHVLHDHDLAQVSTQDAMHFGALSAEELEIEKKLKRKIDFRIMPLVILVYVSIHVP